VVWSPVSGRSVGSDEENISVTTSSEPAGSEPEPQSPAPETETPQPSGRRRITRFVFLVFGLLVALYLGTQGPKEQHVRLVLGAAAPDITALDLRYLTQDGDIAREVHFVYPKGLAPRVVAHEPRLPDGDYRLQIDVDARDGRREVQRQVTLGGGSTQVDVSSALARENHSPE
jgi:hypothetical protein